MFVQRPTSTSTNRKLIEHWLETESYAGAIDVDMDKL